MYGDHVLYYIIVGFISLTILGQIFDVNFHMAILNFAFDILEQFIGFVGYTISSILDILKDRFT